MTQYPKYISLDISSDATLFEFTSIGPKGEIKKIIQFFATRAEGIYNLAFGSMKQDGTIDDVATNNNKDRDKILATVAATVYDFTKRYPHRFVFFTGSTVERTRLYRMAITLNYKELNETFYIWGLLETGEFEAFRFRVQYFGFLIQRK